MNPRSSTNSARTVTEMERLAAEKAEAPVA